MPDASRLQGRLRADLLAARRRGDIHVTAAIASLLTALGNAEAVGTDVASSTAVTGRTEVPRRVLPSDEVVGVVEQEIEERRNAIVEYERLGSDVTGLRAELETLESYRGDA